MRNLLKRKKKQKEENSTSATKTKGPHNVTKTDFPITAPVMTYNFGDLLRYFKYYMGSGLIDATVERRVTRELAHKKDFPFRTFFSLIGVGIMIFMIMMGAVVVLQIAPGVAANPPTVPGIVQG